MTEKPGLKDLINKLDKNILTIINDMVKKKKKENDMLNEINDEAQWDEWIHEFFCSSIPESAERAQEDQNL